MSVASLLLAYPPEWRCDVTVVRGGRDEDGNPIPPSRHVVTDCVIGPRATKDPIDRSDVPDTGVTLYGPPRMDVRSTDRIEVPDGHFMPGVYEVDGTPGFWPLGTEVYMKQAKGY